MNLKLSFALLAMFACAPLHADSVKIENAWARATAPGQPVGAAFMDLVADAHMTLLSATSPASKIVELHTMSMDKGVMVMRQLKKIDLPKGETVNLRPGGLHIMLIDLNAPLEAGKQTQITLRVKDSKGKTSELSVDVPVHAMTASAAHHH